MRHSGDRGSRRACIALRRCVSAPPDGPFISSTWCTASVRTVRYTYHQQYCPESMPRRFVPGFSGPRRCRLGATSRGSACIRCIYPLLSAPPFVVASIHCCCCCISRSSSVHRFIITPHIAIFASIRIRIHALILVPPLVCFTISGGPMSMPPTLVRVPTPKGHVLSQFASLLCLFVFLPVSCLGLYVRELKG